MDVIRAVLCVGVRIRYGLRKSKYHNGKIEIKLTGLSISYLCRVVGSVRWLSSIVDARTWRTVAMGLCRLCLIGTLVLSCVAIHVPQTKAAIDHVTGTYDNTAIVFTLFLTEPSRAADGWTFQLFVNSDNLTSTGYGDGIEFVAATDDLVDNDYIHVRGTATSDGPGGWGSSLTTARLTFPDDMTVVMEIPLSTNVLPAGFVHFGFEIYLNGRIVDAASSNQTNLANGGVECFVDNECKDDFFCTGIETCVNGFCQTTGDPCPGQQCDNRLSQCVGCLSDTNCDDGLFCNGNEWCDTNFNCQPGSPPNCESDSVSCTTNDFCDETLDLCNGTPDDSLCTGMFACVPFLGCTAIDSEVPYVTASGSHFISIEPQPSNSIIPVSIFVTSPNWPCLGKYVGPPTAVDFDNNRTLDGTVATLVDDPLDAARLTPNDWTGKACNNVGPSCYVDSDCGKAGKCLPIRRCNQTLLPCDASGNCPAGDSCVNAQLHITGYEIIPSSFDKFTRDVIPVQYTLMVDSAGFISAPVSVEMQVFGDVDMNAVVNATDIGVVINAFQGIYHQPNAGPINSFLPAVDQVGTSICATSVPVIVTANDILMTIKSFQLFSFADLATLSGCPTPCP